MILGACDPGKNGAIVVIDSDTKEGITHKLKYDGNGELILEYLDLIFGEMRPQLFMHEKLHGWKSGKGSAASMFNQGSYYGQSLLATRTYKTPFKLVSPREWQKNLHRGINANLTSKQKTMIAYRNHFPSLIVPRGPRGGPEHDGIIDALMICVYGFQEYGVLVDDWKLREIN